MEKELSIIAVDPEDRERKEIDHLNACAEKNRAALEVVRNQRNAANRKRYNVRTVYEIGGLCALGAAVTACGFASLIHPAIVTTVALSSMCLSFLRFGVWIGRHRANRKE